MSRPALRSAATAMTVFAAFLFGEAAGLHAQRVPPPEELLGFEVGADYHLVTYKQAIEYFRALEQASPRMRLFEIGQTTMGQPMIYAVISSEENMARLDRLKEIAKSLSLVKGLTDEEARALAQEGKPIVYIDGGLHSGEVAPAQHHLPLAYGLVTGEDAATRFILDNTVLVLVFANPDGMDKVAEWYHANVGTPFETSRMPYLANPYAGGDVNRDSYMGNMIETQHLIRIPKQEWYPVILYNHHQTAPFPARIWVHPTSEPTNPNSHPLLVRWQNFIGTAMGAAFDREGKPGAVSRNVFDMWYPGYVTNSVDAHNIISLLTETALYRWATPNFYTLDDFPDEYKDFTVSAFYPSPWKGGWWHLKDAVDYCITASRAVLDTAAKYPVELLYDKYRMGRDTMERFSKEPPHAWIIPRDQWDPPTAALLLNKMRLQNIDVYAADEAFVSDGISYPAGTWVIPMTQPFALFVKNLFEEQAYPDLSNYPHAWQALVRPQKFPDAYLPPYDMVGWTLPYQMGVKVAAAQSPLDVGLSALEHVDPPAGKVDGGAGYGYLLSPKVNNSFTAVNRILKEGGEVERAKDAFSLSGKEHPAGTFIIRAGSVSRSFMDSLAQELSLTVDGAGGRPSAETFRMKAPKVALYKSWVANADEGWTRWIFEQFEFPYTTVHDADVKSGNLRERFDVFVIPPQSTNAIVDGHKKGTMPLEYVGGITDRGVRSIKAFVKGGGTLVTLNDATLFAIEKLGLPVRDALEGLKAPGRRQETSEDAEPPQFAGPGSLVRMAFDPAHPVTYGMPESGPALFNNSPAFSVNPSFEGGNPPATVAKYSKGELLMSGFMLGENHLHGKSSAVEVPLGEGRVILIGFGALHRAQPHGTFKLLFNSLYYGSMQ